MNTTSSATVATRGLRAWIGIALGGLAMVSGACTVPPRVPLTSPYPLTQGGTPVPGNGLGVGLILGDGLQGQELYRKELRGGWVGGGLFDRASLALQFGRGDTNDESTVVSVSGKVRLGAFLGRRSSTALFVASSSADRFASDQDESLQSWDVALPTEWLLTEPDGGFDLGAYAGPRFVHEAYDDHLVVDDSFHGWIPGILGGLHLRAKHFHLFAEGTLAFRPETERRGLGYDGGAIFLPAIGMMVHVGSPFRWSR